MVYWKNQMKGTGVAHPTQGLICFHGFRNKKLRIYPVDVIYSTIGLFITKTTIEFSKTYNCSQILINGNKPKKVEKDRIDSFVNLFKDFYKIKDNYRIESTNNFQSNIGLGSSASGFAALTLAIKEALGLSLTTKDLSIWARKGTVSAAASIVGGISILKTGTSDKDSFAYQILNAEQFPYKIVIALIENYKSTEYLHQEAPTSPFYKLGIQITKEITDNLRSALLQNNLDEIRKLTEKYLFINYAILSTGYNNVLLWKPATIQVLTELKKLNHENTNFMFFTMSSGAVVFIYPIPEKLPVITQLLEDIKIPYCVSEIGCQATISNEHIF